MLSLRIRSVKTGTPQAMESLPGRLLRVLTLSTGTGDALGAFRSGPCIPLLVSSLPGDPYAYRRLDSLLPSRRVRESQVSVHGDIPSRYRPSSQCRCMSPFAIRSLCPRWKSRLLGVPPRKKLWVQMSLPVEEAVTTVHQLSPHKTRVSHVFLRCPSPAAPSALYAHELGLQTFGGRRPSERYRCLRWLSHQCCSNAVVCSTAHMERSGDMPDGDDDDCASGCRQEGEAERERERCPEGEAHCNNNANVDRGSSSPRSHSMTSRQKGERGGFVVESEGEMVDDSLPTVYSYTTPSQFPCVQLCTINPEHTSTST